jgi:small subunit ribosomal protein S4
MTPPGQHGASRKKNSEYSLQLREKQKTKRVYGILEKQFKLYYEKADRMRGMTGENMLILIERRLDNVVYRLGLGMSRAQARQIVNHGLVCVNDMNVNIPSYLVKAGDVISVKENKKDKAIFADVKAGRSVNLPKWLTFDNEGLKGNVVALPQREDIDFTIADHLIVELYSK